MQEPNINIDKDIYQVFAINPMIARLYNLDFDGDSMTTTMLQSEQARKEFLKLFTANHIKLYFDPDSYIPSLNHEPIYSLWAITNYIKSNQNEFKNEIVAYDKLEQVSVPMDKANSILDTKVLVENLTVDGEIVEMPLFHALVNKVVYQFDFDKQKKFESVIDPDTVYSKKNYTELFDNIYEISRNNIDFYNRIWKLDQFLAECSSVVQEAIPTFETDDFTVELSEIDSFKKQFVTEPVIGFHQNMYLFKNIVMEYLRTKKGGKNILNKLFQSGSRLKSVQLMKSVASNGIPTDVYGRAVNKNISTSLLEGLTPEEMFTLSNGARLALAAREDLIPKAGEFQRNIMTSIGFIILDHNKEDCGSTQGLRITVKNEKHLRSLQERYTVDGYKISKDDKHLIGQEIELRSPVTCKHENFKICKKCWGDHLPLHDNKGYSYLGALASSAIIESLLQSALRLHHTGGTWELENDFQEIYDIIGRSPFHMIKHNGKDVTGAWLTEEDKEALKSILYENFYENDELSFIEASEEEYENAESIDFKLSRPDQKLYLIIPHVQLESQDASKIIKEFANLVYRRREKGSKTTEKELIPVTEMYYRLIDIIFSGSYLLSVYIETILSALFYDEDGVNLRYTDKEIVAQIPLKSVISELDPVLNIFYRLSSNSIKGIYENRSSNLDHMMYRLTDCYY